MPDQDVLSAYFKQLTSINRVGYECVWTITNQQVIVSLRPTDTAISICRNFPALFFLLLLLFLFSLLLRFSLSLLLPMFLRYISG